MIQLKKVTWYSKLLAVLLFFATFAVGFYLGMEYADVHNGSAYSNNISNGSNQYENVDPEVLLNRAHITIPGSDVSLQLRDGSAEFIDPQTGQSGQVSIDQRYATWENGTRSDVTSVLHVTVGDDVSHSYLAIFSIRNGKAIQSSADLLGDRVTVANIHTASVVNPLPDEEYIIGVQFSESIQIPMQFFLVGGNAIRKI